MLPKDRKEPHISSLLEMVFAEDKSEIPFCQKIFRLPNRGTHHCVEHPVSDGIFDYLTVGRS